VPIFATATPVMFHRFFNKLRGRMEVDTFPTFYKANTIKKIASYAKMVGFEVESINLIEGRPEYLRISPLTYLPGALYERLVNSNNLLRQLRAVMLISLRKGKNVSSPMKFQEQEHIVKENARCAEFADTRELFRKV
jgi:hypothetical protein